MTGVGAAVNNNNKEVTFKIFAPFFGCLSEMNNS